MNRPLRASLIGTAATVALVVGASAPALAASTDSTDSAKHPHTLAEIQASAKVKTDKRIASLTSAIARVTANKQVSDADRAAILETLNHDLSGMHDVEAKIAADTSVATAATDYATIFTGYRVYAVALPQSHFAAAADRMTSTAVPRLTDAQKKLSAALSGKYASKSTPELQADLADMTTQIDAASALLDGLAAKSLAVTPADYNSNHDVLSPIRTSIKTAIADLNKARADAKTVLAAIK